VLHGLEVVAVHRSEVLQPEVLEQSLRGDDVLQPLLHPVQRLEHRGPDDGGAFEHLPAPVEEPFVALCRAQRREVLREAADGRRIGALVVVDDDDDRPVLGRRDVVQCLPGHAPGQRAVADDGDDVAVAETAQLVGLREPVGVRQGGGGMGVLDDIVFGLGPAGVAGQAAALPQPGESVPPARQQFVDVGLMPGVEEDPVARGVEDPVQCQGQLHDAEVGAEMPAGAGHRGHQVAADLRGELRHAGVVESAEISRSSDIVQPTHAHSSHPPDGTSRV
jgi:hypothetical protein